MPWKKMRLRGTEVFARVDAKGEPIAESGRVDVHYRPGTSRTYKAGLRNLEPHPDATLLPEDHCRDDAKPAAAGASEGEAPRAKRTPASSERGAAKKNTEHAHETEHPRAHERHDEVVIYADGACTGNPGPAGLGVVILDQGRRTERSEYLGHGTNNIAELMAVKRALEAVPDAHRALSIHTDSQYAIGVLSKGWKAKANTALITELREMLKSRPRVRFVHVRGHSGIPLNERADELARESIETRRTVENVVHDPAKTRPSSGRA